MTCRTIADVQAAADAIADTMPPLSQDTADTVAAILAPHADQASDAA